MVWSGDGGHSKWVGLVPILVASDRLEKFKSLKSNFNNVVCWDTRHTQVEEAGSIFGWGYVYYPRVGKLVKCDALALRLVAEVYVDQYLTSKYLKWWDTCQVRLHEKIAPYIVREMMITSDIDNLAHIYVMMQLQYVSTSGGGGSLRAFYPLQDIFLLCIMA